MCLVLEAVLFPQGNKLGRSGCCWAFVITTLFVLWMPKQNIMCSYLKNSLVPVSWQRSNKQQQKTQQKTNLHIVQYFIFIKSLYSYCKINRQMIVIAAKKLYILKKPRKNHDTTWPMLTWINLHIVLDMASFMRNTCSF